MAIGTCAVTTAHIAPNRMWKLMVIPLYSYPRTRLPRTLAWGACLINPDQPFFVPEAEQGRRHDGAYLGQQTAMAGISHDGKKLPAATHSVRSSDIRWRHLADISAGLRRLLSGVKAGGCLPVKMSALVLQFILQLLTGWYPGNDA